MDAANAEFADDERNRAATANHYWRLIETARVKLGVAPFPMFLNSPAALENSSKKG